VKRNFRLLSDAVRVSLERGELPAEIVPVLTDAARLAREKKLRDLLVISGVDDPASPGAVCEAMDELHRLGAPPPFRIAFVACLLPQYSAYHFAERYAEKFGIAAKVLVSIYDAENWLGLRTGARPALRPR
jgi:hypothetical protein